MFIDTHHLRTILWLRWRLMVNQWRKAGPINIVVGFFIVGVVLVLGFCGALIGFWAGFFKLNQADPLALLATWDGLCGAFLFFWMIGILSEIQRSESIGIDRLLHLPISVKQIFVINYLASHLTMSIVLFCPGMVCLALALMMSHSLQLGLLLLSSAGLLFTVTAWTYCLRGWLAPLMSNPRKRRVVVATVTFIVIVITQLPNLLSQTFGHRQRHRPAPIVQVTPAESNQPASSAPLGMPKPLLIAHQTIPFLWVGHSAMTLSQGQLWPTLWRAGLLFVLGGLGLKRAYTLTIRYYQGQSSGSRRIKAKTKKRPKSEATTSVSWLERRLPGLSQPAGALALGTFRSLMRAPEVKSQLATQMFFLLFFGVMALFRHTSSLPPAAEPFMPTGAVIFTFMALAQLMFNQFGLDRNGFRSYLLWPTPRHEILLGKNLSFLPIALFINLTFLIIVTIGKKMALIYVLCGLLQMLTGFMLVSLLANVTSVLTPFRIGHGSLKATKRQPSTILLSIILSLCMPLLMIPIALIPTIGYFLDKFGWIDPRWSNPILSLFMLGWVFWLYGKLLIPQGRLLQHRQQAVLDIVTHEVE